MCATVLRLHDLPQVNQPGSTAAQRLRHALQEGGVSARALSRRLADRPEVDAAAESIRRSISNWLAGETIGTTYQQLIEDELGLPAGFLYEPNVTAIRQRSLEQRVSRLEVLVHDLQARLVEALAVSERMTELVQEHRAMILGLQTRLEELESRQDSRPSGSGAIGTRSPPE